MLKTLSAHPVRLIFCVSGVACVIIFIATLAAGNTPLLSMTISLGFTALGAVAARTGGHGRDVGAAGALIGQAIALTTAFEGHPWQLDSHMLFFALLACLVALRSIPALLAATAIIAVHHLTLTMLMPTLVYPSVSLSENLARTIFHAGIVLVEAASLCLTVLRLQNLDAQTAKDRASLEESLKSAEAAHIEAKAAKEAAQAMQCEAETAATRFETLLEDAKRAATEREAAVQKNNALQQEIADAQHAKAAEQQAVFETITVALSQLTAGDLTTRITAPMPGEYEALRTAINTTTRSLEALVQEVTDQTQSIESEIKEVSAVAADLAKRAEQKSQMLSQATEELGGLTVKVQNAAHAVDAANVSAKHAQSNAHSSETIVAQASDVMVSMKSESAEISKIVEVIDHISFQTNLLALNAGVEAARAGEAGRGFAVVASEVRSLAQRSSDSATSIRTLIDRSGDEVERGTEKIGETILSLQEVLKAVFEITGKTELITKSTHEQKADIEGLNAKIAQLDKETQKNAAMFQETATACGSLHQSAKALRGLTAAFHVSAPGRTQDAAA